MRNSVKRVARIVVCLSILAVCLIMVLPVGGNTAYAAAATHKTSRAGNCIEHDVTLDSTSPAIVTCGKYDTDVAPFTSEDRCSNGNARLEIKSASTGSYCFYGAGYLGLGGSGALGIIYHVTEVRPLEYHDWATVPVCGSGWVMYHTQINPTGIKFFFGACSTYNSGNSLFSGPNNVTITQVNLND